MEATILGQSINVNCHSSICINDCVYIDPYNITQELHNAKVIFLTHPHYDHCDLRSIENLSNQDTIVVGTVDTIAKVKAEMLSLKLFVEVGIGDVAEVGDVKFKTFASYNIGKQYHPKANGWVGYQLEINGVTFAICGDTDATNELKEINADVLFVPIGDTYTMGYRDASVVTNTIIPQVVVPVHYGMIVGDVSDADKFKSLVDPSINVITLV